MSRAGTIDGLQFARDRDVVTGTLALTDLPRLAELGCLAATVAYVLRGGENAEGHPSLQVEATGRIELRCQRCLEPLDFALETVSELELSTSEREIAAAEDGVDRVFATRSMRVPALVEDEVILALPMVPMHERCEAAPSSGDRAASSPFGALAKLRKGGGGEG
jgi:uncharacterized protein